MPPIDLELRKKISGSFGNANSLHYQRTRWGLIDDIPLTFNPAAHVHQAKDISDANPPYFVIGNTSGTDGYWTGTISGLTAYYEGLRIDYRIGRSGASTTYLNINGLGNVTCYRYSTSKLTTHFGVNYIIPLVYTTLNGGCFMIVGDTYDSTEDYNLRWQNTLTAGAAINGHKIVMQGSNGKFYPLTIEAGTGTTKTVATYDFLLNGTILYYNTGTVLAANASGGGYYFYESIYSGNLHYTANQSSGWVAYRPLYLKGTIQSNGAFRLDNTSYTSWLVQDLPTTDNGFVYILLGYMNDTGATWRLIVDHPIYVFKDGGIRLYSYTPSHNHDDRYYTETELNNGQLDTRYYTETEIAARMFKHSSRDFADGTIITTSINYAVSSGDPFLLMIRGNSYGESTPFDIMVQGYIYSDTIINHGGKSSGKGLPTIYALNVGGYLTFWFARQAYWQGFDAYCIIANTGNRENMVTSITNGVKPTGTKEVNLSTNIKQSIFEGDARLTDARVASDVYSWAKQASKPTYTASEVGAVPTTRTVAGSALSADISRDTLIGVSTNGFVKRTGANTYAIDTATYLTGNQSITLSGDASGSGATAITVTLANSGVTAGTYKSVTVDAKGRVTGGSNPTTLSGYGITDAVPTSRQIAGYALSADISRDNVIGVSTNGFVKRTGANTYGIDTTTYNSGAGTANQIAYYTAANTMASLSTGTYPSLTELAYVKGVTSSIQTQLSGKAASSHTHGNITNAGAIGSTSGLPIITTTSGVLTTGSFGTTAGTFCQGNDSRLSDARTPLSHTHTVSQITDLTATATELNYTDGVTSSIQTQLNTKAPIASPNFTTSDADFTIGTTAGKNRLQSYSSGAPIRFLNSANAMATIGVAGLENSTIDITASAGDINLYGGKLYMNDLDVWTAADFAAPKTKTVLTLASDHSNTSTTMTAASGLSIALVSGKKYHVRVIGGWTGSTTAVGIRAGFWMNTGSATVQGEFNAATSTTSSTSNFANQTWYSLSTTNGGAGSLVTTSASAGTSTSIFVGAEGIVNCTGNGTMYFGTGTASAGNAVVLKAGTVMIVEEL